MAGPCGMRFDLTNKVFVTVLLGACLVLLMTTAACAEGSAIRINVSQQPKNTERQEQQAVLPTATLPARTSPLTRDALRNAEYLDPWSQDEKVQLQDGVFTRRPEVWRLHGQIAFGDLDNDGIDDAVVVLSYSGGGSGTFYSLIAIINESGEPKHVASTFLGDRVRLNSMNIEGGIIALEMIVHGSNDPLCCPTVEVTREFDLNEGDLQLLSEQPLSEAPTPEPQAVRSEPTAEPTATAMACLSFAEVEWMDKFYDGLSAAHVHRTQFEEASNAMQGYGKSAQEIVDLGHAAHGHLSKYSQALYGLLQELTPAPSDRTLDIHKSLEFLWLTTASVVLEYANQWGGNNETASATLLPYKMAEYVLTITYALVGEELCADCRPDGMSKTPGVAGRYNRVNSIAPCNGTAS